jgi:multidrug efflux pump subunit AcrB
MTNFLLSLVAVLQIVMLAIVLAIGYRVNDAVIAVENVRATVRNLNVLDGIRRPSRTTGSIGNLDGE